MASNSNNLHIHLQCTKFRHIWVIKARTIMALLQALSSWLNSAPPAKDEEHQQRLRDARKKEAEDRLRASQDIEKKRPYEMCVGQEYWLFKPENSTTMQLVESAGSAEGEALSTEQLSQLQTNGTCLEARVKVSAAEYWRLPSSASVVMLMNRMGLDTCGAESFLFSNTLVTGATPRGFWMRVIIEDKTLMTAVLDDVIDDEVEASLPLRIPAMPSHRPPSGLK